MAEDDGKKPEDQEGEGNNPNIQSGSEEDAVILDELTSLQEAEDQELGGEMQGRENAGGQQEMVEDMGYMASVHRGGFSTEQDVLAGIVPIEDDNFINKEDIVADDEGGDRQLDNLSDDEDGGAEQRDLVEDGLARLDSEDEVEEDTAERRERAVEEADEPALGDDDDNAITPSVGTLDVFADVTETPAPVKEKERDIEAPIDIIKKVEKKKFVIGDDEQFFEEIITEPEEGPTPDKPIVIYEADIIKAIGPFDSAEINAVYLNHENYLGDGTNGSEDASQIISDGVPIEVTLDENGLRVWTIRTGFENQDSDINVTVTITKDGDTDTSSKDYNYDVDNTLQDDSDSLAWNQTVDIDVLSNDEIIDNNIDYANEALDGQLVYAPNEGFEGTDTLTYTVTDSDGNETVQTIDVTVDADGNVTVADTNITISDRNDNSVAIDLSSLHGDDAISVSVAPDNGSTTIVDAFKDANEITQIEGQDVSAGDTINLTRQVFDATGAPVLDGDGNNTYETVATLTLNEDGTITYDPAIREEGNFEFEYTVTDDDGETSTATVTVHVDENGAPVAVDDAFSGTEDQQIIFTKDQLLSNDTDIDGDTLTITSFDQPEKGTVVDLGNGVFVFTPSEDWNGETDFNYTISDGNGASDTAKVSLTVEGVNDAPEVSSLNLSDGTEYSEYTLTAADLLAAASDVDGDTLSITDVSSSDPDVTITDNGNGTWTIVSSEEGEQSINFSVSDGTLTTTATSTIDFADVDNAPVDDTATVDQDSSVTLNIADLLANDNMIDGGTITGIADTENGNVSIDLDAGTVTFTPTPGYDGDEASFTYTVTDEDGETSTAKVNIDVNDIDNTLIDDNVTLSEDSSRTIDVIDNDTIVDGGTVTGITQPTNGVAVLNADGTVTYTPADDYHGADTFTYTVTDNDGETQIATVNLTIDSVNDAPVVDSVDLADGTEYATYTISESDLLANASDVDVGADLEVTGITGGSNLTINEVTQPGDAERSWEIVSSEEGEESITFTVTDNQGATVSQTAVIDFADVDNAPVDDSGETDQDKSVTFNISDLLANDNIVDGGTITGVTETEHGEVSIDFNAGTITFTPDAGYDGTDASFTYSVTDEDGEITNATVNIDINDIDNTLADDSATLAEDSSKTINVIDNDTIVDGGTVTGITQPTNGVAVLNDDGTVTYTPTDDYNGTDSFTYTVTDNDGETQIATVNLADDYNGTDSFTYTVTDNDGETQIATVNLTVTPENDAPVIDSIDLADGTEYAEYTLTAADLLAAASDVDGDTLSITDVSSTDPDVSITDNGDGTWTIVSDEEGEQPINFSVSDGTT
ncbi:tandem-95 repeat protein, partial [Terasakiella sp. A23]|uniref:tandem-95 repeat protein n=1 Tax=Terasakiella sp. FCG-A23 TaxID=3080561 RepID=UPI002953001D